MKRYQATILFILILLVAKLSEPDKVKEQPPEQKLIWVDDGRVFTADSFFDLSREDREKLIKNLYN